MTHEERSKNLTRVQARFVKEYPLDFNGAEAYMRASGIKNKKSAGVQACKLLKMDKVKDAIDLYVQEQLGPLEKDLIGNVNFWIAVRDGTLPGMREGPLVEKEEILKILDGNVDKDIYKAVAALREVSVNKTKVADQLKASEHLAKYRAMFIDRKEVAVEGTVTIVDDIK